MKTINYSSVTLNDLETIFDIENINDKTRFHDWFLQEYIFSTDEEHFLEKLIVKHFQHINSYTELELISKFIAPILNMVDFDMQDKAIRDFYEVQLKFQYHEEILFNGRCDFVVAKGYDSPINPYFFIQEFKQTSSSFPEYQLLTELIMATLINQTNSLKGAYIVGSLWSFVIVEKIKDNYYKYFVSKKYDGMDIDDLKQIYKNLQIVKREIYESH